MEGYQRSYSSLNWPPMLIEQNYLELIIIIRNGSPRETAEYSSIQAHYIFQPVAFESLSPINASGRVFLSKLGRKLAFRLEFCTFLYCIA